MDDDRMLRWTPQLEEVIKKLGEQARGYAWLHMQAERKYAYLDTLVSIPVIVLSTVTGFLSASTGTMLPFDISTSIMLGSFSVSVGILQTLGTKFGWGKRSEGHRVAYLSYSDLFNFLNVEMRLSRKERIQANDLIKMVRETMKRLISTSPSIPTEVIASFNAKFKDVEVAVPVETNGLEKITVFQDTEPTSPVILELSEHARV